MFRYAGGKAILSAQRRQLVSPMERGRSPCLMVKAELSGKAFVFMLLYTMLGVIIPLCYTATTLSFLLIALLTAASLIVHV